jgi:hypothetical protein
MGGCGGDVGDGEKATEGGPKCGGELGTSVTGDGGRDSKPLDPAMQKGGCAVCGGDGRQGDGLWPARGSVNYREKVCETRRAGEGADQIHMDVGETAVGNWDVGRLQADMAMDLASLAG